MGAPNRSANLLDAFRHALSGWLYAVRTQRNAKIHLAVTAIVVVASIVLGITPEQWCLIILATGFVWMAELANTALEALVDLVSPEYHALAKTAKDVKAAAVVAAVVSAVLVGAVILLPALLKKLGG